MTAPANELCDRCSHALAFHRDINRLSDGYGCEKCPCPRFQPGEQFASREQVAYEKAMRGE